MLSRSVLTDLFSIPVRSFTCYVGSHSLRLQYKKDLENAYINRQAPKPPPDGVHDGAQELYEDFMLRFKRLEVSM